MKLKHGFQSWVLCALAFFFCVMTFAFPFTDLGGNEFSTFQGKARSWLEAWWLVSPLLCLYAAAAAMSYAEAAPQPIQLHFRSSAAKLFIWVARWVALILMTTGLSVVISARTEIGLPIIGAAQTLLGVSLVYYFHWMKKMGRFIESLG